MHRPSMNKQVLTSLFFIFTLQACGGSSSSTETVPKPDVVIEYSFSLSSQLTNRCGVSVPFADVELLLQDDNWQTVTSYQADESGVIAFTTLQDRINYTLVAKNQQGDEAQGLNVVSYYQAEMTTSAMYHAQFDQLIDDSSCECVTQDVELKHRPFALRSQVVSSLSYDGWHADDEQTTIFENVTACRVIDAEWPLHSFVVLGEDVNQQEIGAGEFLSDFSANVENIWSVPAFQVADNVELPASHQGFNITQLIQGIEHFSLAVTENDSQILLFNTHPYVSEAFYQSAASVTFQETSSIFGSTVIKSYHQVISPDYQQSFTVHANEQKPNIDDINFSEIKVGGSYDYSAVSGYPMAVISFTYATFDPQTQLSMPAKWTFYGPINGMLASSAPLTGYEEVINIDTDKKSTKVLLLQSSKSDNYSDYVDFYQNGDMSRTDTSFVGDLRQYEIEITLN